MSGFPKLPRAALAALLALAAAGWTRAAPLVIPGVGALDPNINYQPPDPMEDQPATISFTETFSVSASLNLSGVSGYIDLQLSAPDGYRFEIDPDASTRLSVAVSYVLGASNIGLTLAGPIEVSYTGLAGSAPSSWNDFSSVWSAGFTFSLWTDVDDEFSFTSLLFRMPVNGTGNNVNVTSGDHQFTVNSSNYAGTPSGDPPLLKVAAVPEPAEFAAALGIALILLCVRRALTRSDSPALRAP